MDYYLLTIILVMSILAIFFSNLNSSFRRLERKVNLLMRHQGIDPLQGIPLSDRVKEIANDPSRKIQAIKEYREETGASLKEAKDAIETYINSK